MEPVKGAKCIAERNFKKDKDTGRFCLVTETFLMM